MSTRKIKLLYSFPFRLGRAGIGNTAWHQISGVVNQGVEVSLFCGSCERIVEGARYVRETLKYGPLPLPIKLLGRNKACVLHDRIVTKALRVNPGKFDIIHCWPSGALSTLKMAKKLGIKTVLERPSAYTRYVFEIVYRECQKLGIKLNRSHYAAFDSRRLAREEGEFEMADKLACPSDFVVETFLQRGFDREKLFRHIYGFDPSVFSVDYRRNSEKDGLPFHLLYIGDCSPLKGLHYALQAWIRSKASKKGKFIICGGMVSDYWRVIKGYLAHPSIEYRGFVQNVAEVMCNCDALVLPSLAEGSALVTYEAMACGCVLLVSSASGAVCEHMKDGLVHTPGDVNALRNHMDLLVSERELLLQFRNSGLREIHNFTWSKASELLVNFYGEYLNK